MAISVRFAIRTDFPNSDISDTAEKLHKYRNTSFTKELQKDSADVLDYYLEYPTEEYPLGKKGWQEIHLVKNKFENNLYNVLAYGELPDGKTLLCLKFDNDVDLNTVSKNVYDDMMKDFIGCNCEGTLELKNDFIKRGFKEVEKDFDNVINAGRDLGLLSNAEKSEYKELFDSVVGYYSSFGFLESKSENEMDFDR